MSDPALSPPPAGAAPAPAPSKDDYRLLSVRQLMWRKFLRNRLAVISAIVLILLYLATIFAGFVAPYGPQDGVSRLSYAPPTVIRFCDETEGCSLRPFVYGFKSERNPETFLLEFVEDRETPHYIYFFERGAEYKILGLIPSDWHLFGTRSEEARVSLLGNDQRGRDLFSRIIYGGQVSLSVGLVGVLLLDIGCRIRSWSVRSKPVACSRPRYAAGCYQTPNQMDLHSLLVRSGPNDWLRRIPGRSSGRLLSGV